MTAQAHAFDPVRALRSRGTLYTLATALQLSVAILVLPAITRLLSPGDYGVVAVAIVVQLVLALVGAAGFPETLARTFFKFEDGPERARALVAVTVGTSVAVAVVAEVTGAAWSPGLLDLEYSTALRVAVWSSVPFAILITAQAVLKASDQARDFLATAAVGTAGAQVLGVAFLALVERSPAAYLGGMASGVTLAAVVALKAAGVSTRPLREAAFLRSSFRVSLPTVSHGLALYLVWAGDRAVVNRIEGSGAAGRYHVAYLVGGLTILFVSAIYNAWTPIVFGSPEDRRWIALADTTDAVYRVASLTAGVTAIGAPLALLALTPPEYRPLDLAIVSSIVALSVLPFVAYTANVQVVLWHGRTLVMAWVTPLVAAVNVGLNFTLVPSLGLVGAAVASVGSYALLAILMGAAARRLASVPWRSASVVEATLMSAGLVGAAVVAPTGGSWLVVRLIVVLALLAWLVVTVLRLRTPG